MEWPVTAPIYLSLWQNLSFKMIHFMVCPLISSDTWTPSLLSWICVQPPVQPKPCSDADKPSLTYSTMNQEIKERLTIGPLHDYLHL